MNSREGPTSVVTGMIQLARGDAMGFAHFDHTPRAFLISLIPPMILPALVGLATLADGGIVRAVTDLLAAVATLLIVPVISHRLARHWRRDIYWLRYAVAFNWVQFGLSMAILLALLVMAGAMGDGPPTAGLAITIALTSLFLFGYALWLHWFVARTGLAISSSRAIVVVIATYLGTGVVLLVWGPALIVPG